MKQTSHDAFPVACALRNPKSKSKVLHKVKIKTKADDPKVKKENLVNKQNLLKKLKEDDEYLDITHEVRQR